MNRTPLRLAVIGAGSMGRSHIQRIQASGECALAAVCDPDLDRVRGATGCACPAYAELDELLASERIDGAIVATPNSEHRVCSVACVEFGVPVLVEKPARRRGVDRYWSASTGAIAPTCGAPRRRSSAGSWASW